MDHETTTRCTALDERLDDYVDGGLTADERLALDTHLAGCASCRLRLERERELRALLTDYRAATPAPAEGFLAAAVARAARQGRREQRRRWLGAASGALIAASLALWLVGAPPLSQAPAPGLPGITMTVAEPHTLRLLFDSGSALADARLTVELPPGVALAGFPGRREVSWHTSLEAGRNLLPLTLVAMDGAGGELLARLEHGGAERTFRLQITTRTHDAKETT